MKKYFVFLVALLAVMGWSGYELAEHICAEPSVQGSVKSHCLENLAVTDMRAATATKTSLALSVKGTDMVLRGTWEDTPLAREIKARLPFEVKLVGWHGREFYGGLSWQPSETGEGHRTFEEGDVTYCPQNNSIAIFYDKSREPNLTMDVIVIGHIDAVDLSKLHALGERATILFE